MQEDPSDADRRRPIDLRVNIVDTTWHGFHHCLKHCWECSPNAEPLLSERGGTDGTGGRGSALRASSQMHHPMQCVA